jgi:signal transduction histidine kinase
VKGEALRYRLQVPLIAQVMGLVVLSLASAFAVHTLILLVVPPPPPEVYRVAEVAQALKTPGVVVTARNGHTLSAQIVSEFPAPAGWNGRMGRLDCRMVHDTAQALGLSDDRIVIDRHIEHGALQRRYNPNGWDGGSPGRYWREAAPPPPQSIIPCPDQSAIPVSPAEQMIKPGEQMMIAPFLLGVKRDDGRWTVMKVLGFLIAFLGLSPIAYVFARGLSAPIVAFAKAARRLGRDPGAPPLELDGPREVVMAVEAFNEMQERIRRYVFDRTAMIGAIAHDLRTPLTRLRFRIEQAPDDLREKLAADLDEMEDMVAAALAFVRDASMPAHRQKLDLVSLVETVVQELAETGSPVEFEESPRLVIEGDPLALRRLLSNLIVNAVKFGERARVRVRSEAGQAVVEVDDDGPGVPVSELDRVFEPFFRREPSRNRQTGGAGLGLAVVRSVARAHGGDAILVNRANGGLTARAVIPL